MSPMDSSYDCRVDRDGTPPPVAAPTQWLRSGGLLSWIRSADGEAERVKVAAGADILVVVFHGVN